jgi:hypothetical protein
MIIKKSVFILLITGFLILFVAEIARVFFIMPFPGSQQNDTLEFAYFLHTKRVWFRVVGFMLFSLGALKAIQHRFKKGIVFSSLALAVLALVYYAFNFKMQADKMFYQPSSVLFASAQDNKVPLSNLVMGVVVNGKSKAYPIEMMGYHHQLRDTLENQLLMVTYCTVCRTGRVFNPMIQQKPATFRLVGMDHFNAMFEDEETGSWWMQVNGQAVAGKHKGETLEAIPVEQTSLKSWLEHYPDALIFQGDSLYKEHYDSLAQYDEGTKVSKLTGRDSLSWKDKSWVVGVNLGLFAKAYDWNELVESRIINDQIANTSVVVALSPDSVSFHVWKRDSLLFTLDSTQLFLADNNTNSRWNWKGECVEGALKGSHLEMVQAYQQFWHSWSTFYPHTKKYQTQE